MKKLLELSLKSAFVAYIVSAFDFIGGFEIISFKTRFCI